MFQKIKHAGKQTFNSLSVKNYRLYFLGQGISITGTWMQTIAQTWLVLELTHSATAIGLLVATQFLPILLLGPLGGVIADRFPKRRVLFITQSTSLLLALVLGLLYGTHIVQLWMVFLLAMLLGLVTVVDNPTRQSFIMELVGPERLQNAVTLNSIEVNIGRVIGPTIAGIIIAKAGLGLCFYINAISYIAVLVCLVLMDGKLIRPAQRSSRVKGKLREGLAYVAHTPSLLHPLIMLAIIGTLSYEFQVVLPVLASRTFGQGAGLYALFYVAMSIGSIAGGLYAASRRRLSPKSIATSAMIFGTFMIATAFAPTVFLATTLLIGVGVGSILFSSVANSYLQLHSSPDMRGRVMSLWSVAFLGSTPIGGPIIGLLSDHLSPRVGLATGGLAAIVAAIYGLATLAKMTGEKKSVPVTN